MSINQIADLAYDVVLPEVHKILHNTMVMSRLVDVNTMEEVKKKGQTIDITLPQDKHDPVDVDSTSGMSTTVIKANTVPVTLDEWKGLQWELDDRDFLGTVIGGQLPSIMEGFAIDIANYIDQRVLMVAAETNNYYGTAGSTPSAKADLIGARKILRKNGVPVANNPMISAVLGSDAEANMLEVFSNTNENGNQATVETGMLGSPFGLATYADQNIDELEHIAGTFSTTGTPAVNGAVLEGATVMNFDGGAGVETVKKNDLFTVAGVEGSFVFTADATAVAGAVTGATFSPAAPAGGFDDNALITVIPSHFNNYVFHRNAIVLAIRPLEEDGIQVGDSSAIITVTEPNSGISLRLETWRDPYRKKRMWSLDVLTGVVLVRKEMIVRLLG